MTGGDGFVGSHLKYEKIEDDIRYLEIDSLEGFDCIVHLAALTSVDESFVSPLEYFDINVNGTNNLLKTCAHSGVKRFVFISSTSVKHISDNPNPYAQSKLMGEWLCKWYNSELGIEVIMLRPHNIYGRGCKGVIANFIEAKKTNKEAYVTGDGNQTRDFIYVEDIAESIEKATHRGSGTYEVGTGIEISISRLADLIGVEYHHTISRANDLNLSIASEIELRKISRELGWKPKTSLHEGLSEMMK